jgi:hypothetical protein
MADFSGYIPHTGTVCPAPFKPCNVLFLGKRKIAAWFLTESDAES